MDSQTNHTLLHDMIMPYVVHGRVHKVQRILKRVKEIDASILLRYNIHLDFWWLEDLNEQKFVAILHVWLQYIDHDMDMKEQLMFVNSFYEFVLLRKRIRWSSSLREYYQLGKKIETLFTDYNLHPDQAEYVSKYWWIHEIIFVPILVCVFCGVVFVFVKFYYFAQIMVACT